MGTSNEDGSRLRFGDAPMLTVEEVFQARGLAMSAQQVANAIVELPLDDTSLSEEEIAKIFKQQHELAWPSEDVIVQGRLFSDLQVADDEAQWGKHLYDMNRFFAMQQGGWMQGDPNLARTLLRFATITHKHHLEEIFNYLSMRSEVQLFQNDQFTDYIDELENMHSQVRNAETRVFLNRMQLEATRRAIHILAVKGVMGVSAKQFVDPYAIVPLSQSQ
jgi:hypothetical protein